MSILNIKKPDENSMATVIRQLFKQRGILITNNI